MLIRLIATLVIVGVVVWGVSEILPLIPMPVAFRTIIWVVVVIVAVVTVVQSLAGWPSWWRPGGPPPAT